MTEEEKKAIEYLKAKLYENKGMFVFDVAQEDLRTFLKIVEKLQKEIEELNSEFAINTEIHKRDMRIKELEEVNNCLHETNKELNLENQAFYEKMNCDDNEYISKKYSQLKSVVEILANGIRVLGTNPDITTEEIIKVFTEKPISEEYMKKFESSYISKDEVLKAIGYGENDEEYEKLKQDNEKLLAVLDTMYSEFYRLEDIEDQKVEVAIAFIEEKRDKYWQDKIRDLIKELEEKEEKNYNLTGLITECEIKIETLKELLEEE